MAYISGPYRSDSLEGVIVMMAGYGKSEGAKAELAAAIEAGLEVIHQTVEAE